MIKIPSRADAKVLELIEEAHMGDRLPSHIRELTNDPACLWIMVLAAYAALSSRVVFRWEGTVNHCRRAASYHKHHIYGSDDAFRF